MHSRNIKPTTFSPEEISALFVPQDNELAFSHEGLVFLGVVRHPFVAEAHQQACWEIRTGT